MGSSASAVADTSAVLQKLVQSYQTHGPTPPLLARLSVAMVALAVPMHSRSYRRTFSENYIMLLGDRTYRPEILTAAMSQEPGLWVNGELHQLSGSTMGKGLVLKNCFLEICNVLNESAHRQRFPVGRLRAAMAAFESMWVQFEEVYISELIYIEDLGKRPLAEAIALEFHLLDLEFSGEVCQPAVEVRVLKDNQSDASSISSQPSLPKSRGSSDLDVCRTQPPTLTVAPPSRCLPKTDLQHLAMSACSAARGTVRRELLEQLAKQAAQLNGCANRLRKGRKDLGVEVLEVAADLFLTEDQYPTAENKVRETLATAVLKGFLELRQYFYTASRHMLWIDPQLSNNADLQRGLVAWEEAWEVGNDFLVQPDLRKAFCGISLEAASIQEFQPQLVKLVEEQDAEVFLILPRLVLLSGLWEPSHLALPRSFAMEEQQVEALREEFLKLCLLFPGDQLDFRKLLVAKAMEGPGDSDGQEFSQRLEKFLLQLEGLSMQIQRQEPQRWNRSCQLLLQSIHAALGAPVQVVSL